jgi:type VI secretion system protein
VPLTLHITTSDPAHGELAGRRFEVTSRLTIGRGADNDLVLPDPERHLSKNHCTIAAAAGGYAVTDTSTNGVFLNRGAERLPRGVPVPLGEGSVLRLGGYEITVAAIVPSGAGGGPAASARAAPTSDFLDDPFGDDPFAAPPAARDDDIFGAPPGAAPAGTGPILPDDDDLFGDNKKVEPWHGASEADHAPSDQAFFAPPKTKVEAIPDDWDLADLGIPLGAPATIPAPAAAPPNLAAGAGPAAIGRPVAATPAAPGDSAALAAFLAAVGLSGTTLSDAEKGSLMRLAGEALKTTVEGLTDILAARANTKQEFRIERTMIGAAGNNPLKFSAGLDEALRVMLLGRVPGFLAAPQAIAEALDDVKSHQLAVLAGMQVALGTLIARFDPAKLEQRIEQSSLIEGILPGARKARYWELFRTLYKEIAGELQDDFQKLFGAEFARAYKDQIDKL